MLNVLGRRRIYICNIGGKDRRKEPRRRWEDNIKMDLREIGWGGMDWIHLRIETSRGLL
jgi:hypothetical protein